MKQIKFIRLSMSQILSITIIATLVIIGGLVVTQKDINTVEHHNRGLGRSDGNSIKSPPKPIATDSNVSSGTSNSTVTNAKTLEYMIEEEKLAHDVYAAMYAKWGSRVFGNIQKSEQNHQNQVLTVMQSRNIADPRESSAGVFKDQSLQDLYNKLIAQGNISPTDAFKVGIAIEELDIADLNSSLASLGSTDTDIKTVYESLLGGSKKHLSAFNRQLSR